jgi:hypothetical protein
LHACREREGLRPPFDAADSDSDEDDDGVSDRAIDTKYLRNYGQHYDQKAAELVGKITSQLPQVLRDYSEQEDACLSDR